ncbi:DeoR/GlpR family DNA-binding transcription regulator [Paracoccus sp. SSJ]|uniref:DeoR/GlpR family DNA-binding transcription regulator n=1 Tax=Paracoccus sp. SSJ TaxID=3050636 RepID=UPI00254BF4F8|nr:DeoR/GlpR family DNA-binding transcription regulator [Paracoccus sp. SSJ]MDK8873727.1 DeoR/GlpR family DNA-binding transcription regulator [Paracoccus sp. SSJ]
MWQEERHQKIRAMLASFGQVSIDRIVESFGVSRQTVRRDLIEMEQSGILRRVRGGAVPVETEDMEFSVRITQRLQEKRAICVAALQLLRSHQTIFMDAGSTMTIMAEVLAGPTSLTDLTVVTNSLEAAMRLAQSPQESGVRVQLLRGPVRRDPLETWGGATVADIYSYHADVALLSPLGIDASLGATYHHLHGAEIAEAMARQSTKTAILADHAKIGVTSRKCVCPTAEIDYLVVDAKARARSGFTELENTVAQLIVAQA